MQINDIISSGLLELYVLGKTNAQETAQVLAWQNQYQEVGEELLAIETSLEQLDFAKAVAPSVHAKQNILTAIKNVNTNNFKDEGVAQTPVVNINSAVVKPIKNNWKFIAAVASVLFVAAAINNIASYSKNKKVADALALAEQKINTQKEELATLQNNLEGPLNKSSQQVVLKGTATSPTSTAKIFWIRSTGDVYVEASSLPTADASMQYQLWAIIDGKPVDAGMIVENKKGQKYNIQKMKTFGKAQAFAITLEKAGGSPTPTMTKMVVMSTI